MQHTNIKTRKENKETIVRKKQSKSTIMTDISEMLLELKNQEQVQQKKILESDRILEKGRLYCDIIEQCHNNKPNQILLCSTLDIPFIEGPIALNSLNKLKHHRSINQSSKQPTETFTSKFKKQLVPLFKYLQRIKQKQNYYFWIIYHDDELGILNIKLFTKWDFVDIKSAHYPKKKSMDTSFTRKSKNHSYSTSSLCQFAEESGSEGCIEWDQILVGIFLNGFKKEDNKFKGRVNSVIGDFGHINKKSATGLSNKTTKESFNTYHQQKQQSLNKDKSQSQYHNYQQISRNDHEKNNEQKLLQRIKSPSMFQIPIQKSFIKTSKKVQIINPPPATHEHKKVQIINPPPATHEHKKVQIINPPQATYEHKKCPDSQSKLSTLFSVKQSKKLPSHPTQAKKKP